MAGYEVIMTIPDYISKIEQLEKENQELKADYGTKAQVERDLLMEENQKYKEVIDNIKRFCTSNEWGKYYEISSCRNHILDILKEVE